MFWLAFSPRQLHAETDLLVSRRYGEYEDLRKLVHRVLRRTDRILVIGCGNSNFSAELYDDGFEEARRDTGGMTRCFSRSFLLITPPSCSWMIGTPYSGMNDAWASVVFILSKPHSNTSPRARSAPLKTKRDYASYTLPL